MIHVTHPRQIAIVGAGHLGSALAQRLTGTGHRVVGPLTRNYEAGDLSGAELVLLCVPDREIPVAAGVLSERLRSTRIAAGDRTGDHAEDRAGDRCPLVGHCSGAGTLELLDPLPRAARFSLHPLMTFSGTGEPRWDGAAAAVAAFSPQALDTAMELARTLGLVAMSIDERDRAAYHAAASMASNYLIALELCAERLAGSAGVGREALLPLVRATVENWGAAGADALTGPIARGDDATVERQREAVAERAPGLLELFDVLGDATRELATAPVAA